MAFQGWHQLVQVVYALNLSSKCLTLTSETPVVAVDEIKDPLGL